MHVAHAAWGADRRLILWAEDSSAYDGAVTPTARRRRRGSPPEHPFAATAFDVPLASGDSRPIDAGDPARELVLPAAGGRPLPSPGLPVAGGIDAVVHDDPWRVPASVLDASAALRLLLAVADGQPAVGASLAFFSRLALLAAELVARGRFLPAIAEASGRSGFRWRPVPGASDTGRIAALAAAMPGAGLAAQPDGRRDRAGARHVVEEFLADLVDALVGESAAALDTPGGASPVAQAVTGRGSVPQPAAPLADALDRWEASVRPAAGPFRTLVRLAEPGRPGPTAAATDTEPDGLPQSAAPTLDAPPQEGWRLEFLVGARDDPSVVLGAGDVWADPAPLRAVAGGDPEAALLVDLARASRLYPPMAPVLQQAVPDILELDTPAAHAFLRDGAPLLADAGYTVLLPAWWRRRRRLGLRLHARPRGGSKGSVGPGLGADTLVDYDWRVAVGDDELTAEDLKRLAGLKGGLVRVRGEWVEIEPRDLARALEAVVGSDGAGARPPLTVADVLGTAFGLSPAPGGLDVTGLEASGWLGELVGPGDAVRATPIPTPPNFAGRLRPYQERGLGWLAFLDRLGFGGILADDMGLGKTAQLIALLVAEAANVPAAERLGPTLVICPMSVVGNWQRELSRFAPTLRVTIHHGSGRDRSGRLADTLRDVDVVVSTYAVAARDRAELGTVTWRRVVLDEAQEIKNAETDQSRAARSIHAPSRIALTGTPIENRLSELWTIMDFANPGLLGTEATFRARFAAPIERFGDEPAAERLRRLTGPFILRRVKTDRSIAPDLPDKLVFTTPCGLTREQASLYQAVVDELLPDLEETTDEQAYRGKVLRAIVRLKQVCNHPAHFLGDGSPLPGRSGKLERLEEIVDQVVGSGERLLVFTQFAEWAQRLTPYLRDRFGREVLHLHGGLPRRVRDQLVERFETGVAPIFVLSLKAGGKGLNLVAANHVVHYDRWWNPAVEDQATDRAYRIGQTRDVVVRTFVATGTLEEKIEAMLAAKRDLAERVVRAGERAFTELSTGELREVLSLASDAVAEG